MIALVILLAMGLLMLGFEMFLVLLMPALATKTLFYANLPDVALIQKMVGGINHSTLLAVPFSYLPPNSWDLARSLVA